MKLLLDDMAAAVLLICQWSLRGEEPFVIRFCTEAFGQLPRLSLQQDPIFRIGQRRGTSESERKELLKWSANLLQSLRQKIFKLEQHNAFYFPGSDCMGHYAVGICNDGFCNGLS